MWLSLTDTNGSHSTASDTSSSTMFFSEPEPEPVPPTCTWCAPKPAPEPPSSSYIVKHAYSYDANNNLTFWDDQVNNQYDVRVTYDGLDRIDTISDSYLGAGDVNYDTMGNITYYKLGSRTLNYNYNSSKRLSSVSGSKSYTFNYDDVGNVTDNGSRSFTYNRAGQMVQSGGNSYVYDGNGKRVKTIDSKGVSYSVYGSNGKLMYRQENGQHKDYYYLGNTLVAKKKGSTVTYVHTDYLGSPAAETNSNGDVLARMHYQPFGESIETPSDDAGYTGHKFDTDLDLSYMQARYYDPVIGRFYSNDPVDALGHMQRGNRIAHGFNRYAYANNNPYKYTDPDGEFVFLAIAVVGAAITAYDTYQTYKNEGAGAAVKSLAVGGVITAATGGVGKIAHSAYKAYKGSKVTSGAESALQGVKLEKQLASESQLTELAEGGGKIISQPAKQANRIAEQHGVDAANVQKVSSSAHTAKDGSQVQTHAFRDASTNKVIEPKSIIDENN